jgi:hypothetical protein
MGNEGSSSEILFANDFFILTARLFEMLPLRLRNNLQQGFGFPVALNPLPNGLDPGLRDTFHLKASFTAEADVPRGVVMAFGGGAAAVALSAGAAALEEAGL